MLEAKTEMRASLPPVGVPVQSPSATMAPTTPGLPTGMGGVPAAPNAVMTPTIGGANVPGPPTAVAAVTGGMPILGGAGGGNASAAAAPVPAAPQLMPLPPGVKLDPLVTRVTVVPLVDSVKHIPPLSEEEIEDIKGWMKVDKEYEGLFGKMKERMGEEVREMFGVGGPRAAWWEKGSQSMNLNRWRRGRESFDVRYPRNMRKDRDGRERRRGGKREGLRL